MTLVPSTPAPISDSIVCELEAVVLLAGRVTPTPLTARIGRSVLDLPLEPDLTLLEGWCQQASALAESLGRDSLLVRVVIDRNGPMPARPRLGKDSRVELRLERDPHEFRGTAGVLKDLAAEYDRGSRILVASATQLQLEPLADLLPDLSAHSEGVSMVSHGDGTPSGMMLIRCAALDGVPDVGFVDMKEQALPTIGEDHPVQVVRRDTRTAIPIRTLSDYIQALRVYHLGRRGEAAPDDPYAERWQPVFSLVEEGANVGEDARLQDTVVLRDAVVDDGAVVVRSVVCPGGVVHSRERVIEKIVSNGEA